MSEIPDPRSERLGQATAAQKQAVSELANCYARVFLGSDDGKRVLMDLRKKFGLSRLVFKPNGQDRYDSISAALIDGERHVMMEIENALDTSTNQQKTIHHV